jgi:dTDP-4-dehydrorhamnose reductase
LQKVLVTGSNGLLGQKLIRLLQTPLYANQFDYLGISRGENRLPRLTKNYHPVDLTNLQAVKAAIEVYQPHIIIHTAAMTQVDDCEMNREACWQQNVKAVEYLLQAAQPYQSHFIHLSTDFIFDGKTGMYDEQATPNPISYYGESKLAAEKIVNHSPLPWAIVRTVLVYGVAEAMSRTNIVLWVKQSLEAGKAIKVVNDQWRTPTLAEDLAQGCMLIASQKAKGIFNISGQELLTPYDIALATAHFFQLDASLIEKVDGSLFKQPAQRPPKTGFNIEKAVQLLGYRPHSFQEGLGVLKTQLVS